jgi:hypothetical protein
MLNSFDFSICGKKWPKKARMGDSMGYYVLRKGDSFKIIYMDQKIASLWESEGWETLRYDSNEQACTAMSEWKMSMSQKSVLLPMRWQA